MAKEKSLKIRDLFVKLNSIFPTDIYIIDNLYIFPGPQSNDVLRGYYYCKLSQEMSSLCLATFSDNHVIYIPSIKNIKDDISAYDVINDADLISELDDKLFLLIEDNNAVEAWTNVKDDVTVRVPIERIITSKTTEKLFDNIPNLYPVIMGKKLFPLLTIQTMNKLYFAYDTYPEVDGLSKLHLTYDHPYFQLIMLYTFLSLEEGNK